MTQQELDTIIEKHQHWLKEDCDGWEAMRANLYEANLYGANLEGANLYGAFLDDSEKHRLGQILKEHRGGRQMSEELKTYDFPVDGNFTATVELFYLKSEADKVIAELKKACNDKDDWCLHTLKENRHQKYKRCLAMAKWCEDTAQFCCHVANTLRVHATMNGEPSMMNPNHFFKRFELLTKWRQRWLELAEKFKEAK